MKPNILWIFTDQHRGQQTRGGQGVPIQPPEGNARESRQQEEDRPENGRHGRERKSPRHEGGASPSAHGPGGQHQRDQGFTGAEDEDDEQDPGSETLPPWRLVKVGVPAGMVVEVLVSRSIRVRVGMKV